MNIEKQVRTFTIPFKFDWEYGVEISQIKSDLEELEKKGATHILIEGYGDGDGDWSGVNFKAYVDRLETDEEHQQRILSDNKRAEAIRDMELKQLEQLKQKYEL